MRRARLASLLTLLALALLALYKRSALQVWAFGLGNEARSLIGKKAPELPPLEVLGGGEVKLERLRGRVVLLHFWTFACSNCKRMTPWFTEWHNRYGASGLTVLGVHSPETEAESQRTRVEAFVREKNLRFVVLLDPEFAAWRRYRIEAWPTMVLIDRAGTVAAVYVGDGEGRAIESHIERLLRSR